MSNLHVILKSLLAAILLGVGCKGGEKLESSCKQDISREEAGDIVVAGEWIIDSLSLSSVSVPSFCYRIGEGATFEFTKNDSLRIYPEGALKPCDTYSYTIQNGLLQVVEEDMIMLVEYRFTTERKLMLKSKSFFRWLENDVTDSLTHQSLLDEGVTVLLSRKQ